MSTISTAANGDGSLEPAVKSTKQARWSWMMFDWAAQPFSTLIITFIFAPYFATYVFDDPVEGQRVWGDVTAGAAILVALIAPILGAVADGSGRRKPWIALWSIFAVVGSIGLWWATPGGTAPMLWILAFLVLATIGFEMATIFTNAMMPSLVSRQELGKLSGTGWAIGYVGGVFSLIIMLVFMVGDPESGTTIVGLTPILGLNPLLNEGDRASGPFTAIWYLIFVIPLFLFVPDQTGHSTVSGATNRLTKGLKQLGNTLKTLPQQRSYFSFLIASLLYRDGLNALYAFGGIYAAGMLGLSIIQIGIFGILAAVAGAIGAFIGGRLDHRFGPRPVVFWSCWALVLASVLVISTTQTVTLFFIPLEGGNWPVIIFYIAGSIIGSAGGTLQASSRTLLVDQVDESRVTEAFGLYALAGRATAFIGPFLIARVTDFSGSQRIGVTPVAILLALGAIMLLWVRQHGDD